VCNLAAEQRLARRRGKGIDRRHKQDYCFLIDEGLNTSRSSRGKGDHDRHTADERQRRRHDFISQGKRSEQAHRALREVEDSRGFENQDEAEGNERVKHARQQPSDQNLKNE
jgi:hypothetical protein